MKDTMHKITAAAAGAVLAFSAVGLLPVSAGMEAAEPEDMPPVSAMELLGESALHDGKFDPIELYGPDVTSFDTFYVTANRSCAAQEISITVTQSGFLPVMGEFYTLSQADCRGIVALSDPVFRFKPEYPEAYAQASYMKLLVNAEITEEFDLSLFPTNIAPPEDDTLTIRIYGFNEIIDYIPAVKETVLSQAVLSAKSSPEISMIADGWFRYADIDIDGGKEFDPAGTKTVFGTKVYSFRHDRSAPEPDGTHGTSSLKIDIDKTADDLAPAWKDGAFHAAVDRRAEKKPIPKFAELSCFCEPEDQDAEPIQGMFRMKLCGSAVVDDEYDTFRITVLSAAETDVHLRIAVMQPEEQDGAAVSAAHSEDYVIKTKAASDSGSTGVLELSAKEMNAPAGTVIYVESAGYTDAEGSSIFSDGKFMSGTVTVTGIRDLMKSPEQKEPCYGDVNCSGNVDVSDAVLLARMAAEDKTAVITADGKLLADVNHDGNLSTDDVVMILQYISKLIPYSALAPQ